MKISRSFSRKIQLKQFEPIESSCSVEIETDDDSMDAMRRQSKTLDAFVQGEVQRTLDTFSKKLERKPDPKYKEVGMLDAVEDLAPGIDDV